MTDQEFLEAFESGGLSEFHHRDHIRMAWLYLMRFGFEDGSKRITDGIKHFAAAHHQTRLYHETITWFWILLLRHIRENHPEIMDFDSLIAKFPFLCNGRSIFQHYTREILESDRARHEWCPPDLNPI